MTDRAKFCSLLTKLCVGESQVKTIQVVELSTFVLREVFIFNSRWSPGCLLLSYSNKIGQQSTIIGIININFRVWSWGFVITSSESHFGLTRSLKGNQERLNTKTKMFDISDYDRKALNSLYLFFRLDMPRESSSKRGW